MKKRQRDQKEEMLSSEKCGCYKCLKVFSPDKIDEWWDDDQTAVCPYCGIDSVVGSASGYSITPQILKEMRIYWFNGRLEDD